MAAAILNHVVTAAQALTGTAAAPMDSSTTGTTGTTGTSGTDSSDDGSGNSATISANDFLTLLVTEMQNQDPTADTDPNEYINQLVNVNSLEQLIDINQTLTTGLGGAAASSGTGSQAQAAGTPSGLTGTSPATGTASAARHAAGVLPAAQSNATTGSPPKTQSTATPHAPGNLSVPRANSAAHRVAHALDGRTHAQPGSGGLIAAH